MQNTEPPTADDLLFAPGAAMDSWPRDWAWQAVAIRLVVAAIPGLFLGAVLGVLLAVVVAIVLVAAVTLMLFALDPIVARPR